jgi:hypothetical protein
LVGRISLHTFHTKFFTTEGKGRFQRNFQKL